MTILEQLLDPAQTPHVRRLSQRSSAYLQTVVTNFTLTRSGSGLQLRLKIEDDPLTIVEGLGKRDIERVSRADGLDGRDQLQRRLDALADPDVMGYRVDCSTWPMRYANGGVLPIVHFEGRDYFLLFYRDIFPVGWNIANGASDDEEEWVDPGRIIHREFAEEVLFADPTEKLLYVYEPSADTHRFGFHRDALSAWKPHRPELATFRPVPMPFKWVDGPDSVRVEYGNEVHEHSGFFLSVTPDDHGIEVDRFVFIRAPGDTRLFCGEISDGRPLNHIVGLFEVSRLQPLYSGHEFVPDLFFFNGERYDGSRLPEILPQYLRHVGAEPPPGLSRMRREDQIRHYEELTVRFDFCPISRAIIGRYYQWLDAGTEQPNAPTANDIPTAMPVSHDPPSQQHDLFISHVSRHVDFARSLYESLCNKLSGSSVFLSAQSLAQQGESNYRVAIERALGHAHCLIVLLLDPDDLQSGWVNYEWMTFSSEIIAGRKQGKIFTLMDTERLTIDDLPLGLRQHEVVGLQRLSPRQAIDRLCEFLTPNLRAAKPKT
ncbi:MAG: toll/interleukin-1 receptor domain-containing protein [Planctomycetota bacterium]